MFCACANVESGALAEVEAEGVAADQQYSMQCCLPAAQTGSVDEAIADRDKQRV